MSNIFRSKQDGLFNDVEYQDLDSMLFNDDKCIFFDSVHDHIDDQGTSAQDSFLKMYQMSKNNIIKVIDHFALSIITQTSMIHEECDSNNNVCELEVSMQTLANYRRKKFISEVLN